MALPEMVQDQLDGVRSDIANANFMTVSSAARNISNAMQSLAGMCDLLPEQALAARQLAAYLPAWVAEVNASFVVDHSGKPAPARKQLNDALERLVIALEGVRPSSMTIALGTAWF